MENLRRLREGMIGAIYADAGINAFASAYGLATDPQIYDNFPEDLYL